MDGDCASVVSSTHTSTCVSAWIEKANASNTSNSKKKKKKKRQHCACMRNWTIKEKKRERWRDGENNNQQSVVAVEAIKRSA